MPADQAVAEEEHGSARALVCVDVAGEVTVAVADEARYAGRPGVVKTLVEGARHILKDALDRLRMLHRGLLHEPAHEYDDERQVRPSVHQVAQTADELLVVRGIDLLRRAVPTEPHPFLHWSLGWIAASHAAELEEFCSADEL